MKTNAFINGQWVSTLKKFSVFNPATLEEIAQVSDCGEVEAVQAVEAAHKAFSFWKNFTAKQRADILFRWRDLIVANKQNLARLMTLEQGKPLKEALVEIGEGEAVAWAAEEARRTYGHTIPPFKKGVEILTFPEPIGVVSAITPWNFPHSMITRKIAPALAAGCTVVLKPAQDTPLSALALADLAEQAGMPEGVLNVVTASRENTEAVGNVLTTHEKVGKISFTGSTPVGRKLMAQASATIKKVSLELGGNAPFIVFDAADLEKAADGIISSKFRNAGQTCICANRIFIQSRIYDSLLKILKNKICLLNVGNGLEAETDVGPLINQEGVEKVNRLIKNAVMHGAKLELGGSLLKETGLFFQPALLTDVTKEMDIFSQEIFGPVAPIYRFDTEAEVISLANDTIYGLAAYFYSSDMAQCLRVSRALEYGMVGVNEPQLSNAGIPFGGFKQSGIGREGGPASLGEFMETKYVLFGN